MKKTLCMMIMAVLLITLSFPGVAVLAASGPDHDKLVSAGQYELVTKDANWDALQKGQNSWGKGKFSIENGAMTMRVVAHKLQPNSWYQVEVNDKNNSWTVVSNNDAQYYVKTDADGVADVTFTLDVSSLSGAALEVNLKTAEWANTPTGWVNTPGWGYNYVLYGATTIPAP